MNRNATLLQLTLLKFTVGVCVVVGLLNVSVASHLDTDKPNVLIIYFDDMGYGDMGANGPSGLSIPVDSKYLDPAARTLTPNLDRFANQGLRFTRGHSADGVCSPSRYSLLTGHYSWRTRLKRGVTGGYSSTFMDADRFTIGELFRKHGYTTAMIGKWHIGMEFQRMDGKAAVKITGNDKNVLGKLDLSKPVMDTPAHRGFDYWFGTPASLDMPPYAWLESDSKTGEVHVLYQGGIVADGNVDFSQARVARNSDFVLFDKTYGIHARDGAKDPTFVFADYLQIQAAKVVDLIKDRKPDDKPFMMYVPMPAPHAPHAVQESFQGCAGYQYGDYVVQTDYYTGEILKSLGDLNDPKSVAANTIVFITSDNGPENQAYTSSLQLNHDANGPWAGRKRDNYEGGTCVPFMLRWPGKIAPGTTDHACWQGDFVATMAAVLHYDLRQDEAPDAESFLPVLLGNPMPTERRAGFIEHSSSGQFALIDQSGEWKLIDGTGGGGNKRTCDADNRETRASGVIRGTPRQLFHLKTDPGERDNLLVDDSTNPNDNHDPTPSALAKERELYDILNAIRGDKIRGTDGSSNIPR
ncbi:Arylsulfatase [Planctomycetes bacterium CA13]|uniref:Arylsulfatase n=1 Tax=Novipirellula herctigrandis TaxID=2527986 RepID=A0A5C5Z710_9BACT|nr:Arylsulfatase [Planctomycetes bacterium CA13]